MAGIVLHIPREVTRTLHSDFTERPSTKTAKINLNGFGLFNGHDTQVLIQRFWGLRSRSMRLLHRRLNLLLSRLSRFRCRRRLREDWSIRCRLSSKTRHDTSVDKYYRLARGYNWFEDEQPSDEIKEKVERVLSERDWKIDGVLSHTCPLRYEPTEVFLSMIDQSSVDKSTEQWLDTIESRLHYERWYCGHYHTDKEIDKIRFMFQDYTMLPHQISLSAEKEMIRRMQRQAEIVEALGLMDEAQEEK